MFKYDVILVSYMAKVVIPIPKELEVDKSEIEHMLNRIVELELKKKKLVKFFDELMRGAKHLSEEEVVKFSRKFKKAGATELKLI